MKKGYGKIAKGCQNFPRDAQRDDKKESDGILRKQEERKRHKRAMGKEKKQKDPPQKRQRVFLRGYAAVTTSRPIDSAKAAGSPWSVTSSGEEEERRALRAIRCCQLRRY